MKVKTKVWAWLVAALAAFALVMSGVNVALADAGDEPAHSKDRTDNGDGTYKIELSVTGDATDNHLSDSHVNVLIVYDESSSMNTSDVNVNGTNRTRADVAENAMYTLVNGLVGYKNRGVDIFVAEIGFGTRQSTTVRSGWTSNLTTVRSHFDEGVDNQTTSIHAYSSHNGTDWEGALSLADDLIGGGTSNYDGLEDLGRDEYQTFVILVTDGGPTVSTGNNTSVPNSNWTTFRVHYNAAAPYAYSIQSDANTRLYGIYAFGQDANLLDDLMYYSTTNTHRTVNGQSINNAPTAGQNHDFGEDEGADNYFNATSVESLNAAIESIFNDIVAAMGITEVSMSDGTTNNVTASSGEVVSLLGVVEDSYQYWMTIPLNGSNQFTRTKNVNGTAEDITYTVSSDGTVTWTEGGTSKTVTLKNATVSGGQVRFEWTTDDYPNDFYEYAPNEAELVNGAVEWDLTNVDPLLNGVTYSVTFDVYPSQEALDYKARLDNGEAYDDVVDEDLQQWFHADGSLETNTVGTLTYSDSRDGSGPNEASFEPPKPVTTESQSMTVHKEWEGASAPNADLKLDILMDGDEEHPFYEATLNSTGSWNATFNISAGLIVDGEALPDAMGHDFSFAELDNTQYRWELHAPTVRPMIIDGADEPTILIKEDKANGYDSTGKTTYEIDGATYYVDPTMTTLTATNHRRSNLNIKKVVTGDDAPDEAFPFTITIDNAKAENGNPDDTNSDYYVWFSVRDASNATVTNPTVTGATPEEGNTGYFYAVSGQEFTVELKAGWNLRVTNLPSGTEYTVAEDTSELPDGFLLTKVANTGAADETFEFDGESTATGTIVTYNALQYEATFTNGYATVDVTVDKVWDDASDQDGKRPDELELTLSPEVEDAEPEITKSSDGNTWTYTWTDLPKYDPDSGEYNEETGEIEYTEIEYTVTEDDVPEDYSCDGSPASDGDEITNSYTPETVDIDVEKVWEGPEGDSVTVTLYADGEATSKTVTLSSSNDWKGTFEGLPKNKKVDGEVVEIEYTVVEAGVSGVDSSKYTTTVEGDAESGFTITNTNTETVDFTVKKVWDDASNQDGKRPASLDLTLSPMPDDYDLDENLEITGTSGNTWTYTWSNLPKYDTETGEEITYTVTEGTVPEDYSCDGSPASNNGTITNSYTPETIDIDVEKVWEGPEGDEVTVTLYADGEATSNTLTLNSGNEWKGTFEGLAKYKNVDGEGVEIEYTVVEDGVSGVNKDNYVTTVSGSATDGFTITNTYHVEDEIYLEVTKVLEGRTLEDGQFTFTISGDGPLPEETEAQNTSGGDVVFGPIKFTQDDIYGATTDEGGTDEGGTDEGGSDEPQTKSIEAAGSATSDDADADAIVADEDDEADETAADEADEAVVADEAAETVDAADEAAVDEADETADEPSLFAELANALGLNNLFAPRTAYADEVVTKAAPTSKTFTYTISETGDAPAGYTFGDPVTVTVTVTDDGSGELTFEYSYDPEDATIVNTYKAEGTATIEATKVLESAIEGVELEDGQFSFELKDSSGKVIETVTNDASGNVQFTALEYYQNAEQRDAGKTFKYTITEVKGNETGYTYDTHTCSVTVKVTDDGKGTLNTEVSYSNGNTFTNTYKPKPVKIDPPIKKVITGDTPSTDETFTFQMTAITEGAPMPEGSSDGVKTVSIKGSGEYEFGWIEYTEEGVYEYEVAEVAGSNSNYTYDSNKYTITVTVTDEGGQLVATVEGGEDEEGLTTFTNTYTAPPTPPKPPVVPKTGDETPQTGLLALLGAALLGYGVYRRRKA